MKIIASQDKMCTPLLKILETVSLNLVKITLASNSAMFRRSAIFNIPLEPYQRGDHEYIEIMKLRPVFTKIQNFDIFHFYTVFFNFTITCNSVNFCHTEIYNIPLDPN